MSTIQTYTVNRKRTITAEQQHVCDTCRVMGMEPPAPATSACTDAIQTKDGWTQSKPRYGCPAHPVKPVVEYLKCQ